MINGNLLDYFSRIIASVEAYSIRVTNEKWAVDAIYTLLLVCYGNCKFQENVERRMHYTNETGIEEVQSYRQALDCIIKQWAVYDEIDIVQKLSIAKEIIADNPLEISPDAHNTMVEALELFKDIHLRYSYAS